MPVPRPAAPAQDNGKSAEPHTRPGNRARAIFLVSKGVGGVEIRIGRLFCALYDRDPLVYLVTHRALLERLQQTGIPLAECRDRILLLDEDAEDGLKGFFRRKFAYIRWMLRGLKLARKYRFQAAYLACTGITIGAPLLFRPGTRVIIAYTIPFLRSNRITWFNRVLLTLWLNLCDRIDALNPQNDLHRIVLNRSKISLSPGSFTDLTRFSPVFPKLPWVVWAGHLEYYNQPLFFVEGVAKALADLGPQATDWKFHLLGGGSMLSEVRQRVTELGLGKRLEVWGHVSDVASFFAQSAICASTQKDTNYPSQVLLEAMACENAVIATDVGETRLLADEENAILVNDLEGMATALGTLIRDEVLRTRLGKQGRERVAREHTVERFIQHLDSLWDSEPNLGPQG